VVVAVISVGVVQVPVNQVVDVIAVRHHHVSTIRAMDVVRLVSSTVVRHASIWVLVRDSNYVLVIVIRVGAV
jgi:hypothetical protein